ncbi:unnamed protein product [Peniophora sp. CBMAI 1063]|nr:unnamed protein product [Peniophora sp. CBMAI 1063]
MLDSGASSPFINSRFALEQKLTLTRKKSPLRLRTIDNSPIKSGLVTHEVSLQMSIGEHSERITCDVADIGDDNIILGISWLRQHNPHIDWARSSITFTSPYCAAHCLPRAPKPAAPSCPTTSHKPSSGYRSSFGKKTNTRTPAAARAPPPERGSRSRSLKTFRRVREKEARLEAYREASKVLEKVIRRAAAARAVGVVPEGQRTSASGGSIDPPRGEYPRPCNAVERTDSDVTMHVCPEPLDLRAGAAVFDRRRAAAARSFSQELAEAESKSRKAAEPVKSLEEMVPSAYHDYLDVFDKARSERLPPHREGHDIAIELEEGASIPSGRLYQMSVEELSALKEFIDDSLRKGYIRSSSAPCGAPVFFVKKKDGSLRLVVDYRALNKVTIKDSYPIPLTQELLDRLKSAKVFTTLDMRWGYYNVRVREGDEWKTSFRTRYGQFEFLVMQFGLCNAPAVFQRLVNSIFHDLVDVTVVLYLDDIIIFSEDPSKHEEHVREVLRRLREADLYLKPEKCRFNATEVEYLGLLISPGNVSMDPVKVQGITDWPTPKNLSHVNQFLGFCNFYRRFIEGYSALTRPLDALRKKDVAWRWGIEEERAFREIKHRFVSAPLLMMPDTHAPFVVETDASDFAVGAVLSQYDAQGDLRPVAFFSKAMAPAERNYDIYDKELLAIVRALEEWRPYLEGSPHRVTIYSDHKNLEYFMTARDLTRRQARWSLYLNRFWFLIEHRPGRLNMGADGMSRRADHAEHGRDNTAQTLLGPDRVGKRAQSHGGVVHDPPRGEFYPVSLYENFAEPRRACVLLPEGRLGVVEAEISARVAALTAEAAATDMEDEDQLIPGDDLILEAIREATPRDPTLELIFAKEKPGAAPLLKKRLADYVLEDGVVRTRGLIVVPDEEEIRHDILRLCHDSAPAGHPGEKKTLALVARTYYWPGMSTYVERYVSGCPTCQQSKPRARKPTGPLQPLEIPTGPWQHISADFIVKLPVSNGTDSILVVVDKLLKRARFFPVNETITAPEVADIFFERIWCERGTPYKLVSDRGTQFVSRFMQRLLQRLGIKSARSTSYHPQSDGQTEHVNQDLETYLRMFVNYYQDDWASWLPLAEFAYNSRVHSSTGVSPFYAELGFNPQFSTNLVQAHAVPAADERIDLIHHVQEELQATLELAAETMKRYHDRWVDQAPAYTVGDRVWLEHPHIHSSTRPSPKLDVKRYGPFVIEEKLSDLVFRLALPKSWRVHPVFHVSHLVPFREDSILGRVPKAPTPIEVDGHEEYELQQIIWDRVDQSGKRQYRVRYRGFDSSHDEWLEEYELENAQELLEEYREKKEKGLVRKPGRRRKRFSR